MGIVSYTWTFEYGAEMIILHEVSPSFGFDMPGVYRVRLNVSNEAGLWSIDTMVLTVRDITPPVANAGTDQRVTIGTPVNLSGGLSNDNVGITVWHWNFTYDGKVWNLEGENASVRFDRAGVYNILLTAVDMAGNRGEDQVTITVVAPPMPPTNVENGGLNGFLVLLIAVAVAAVGAKLYARKKRNAASTGAHRDKGSPKAPVHTRNHEEKKK
jgi:PKD repeat protein